MVSCLVIQFLSPRIIIIEHLIYHKKHSKIFDSKYITPKVHYQRVWFREKTMKARKLVKLLVVNLLINLLN